MALHEDAGCSSRQHPCVFGLHLHHFGSATSPGLASMRRTESSQKYLSRPQTASDGRGSKKLLIPLCGLIEPRPAGAVIRAVPSKSPDDRHLDKDSGRDCLTASWIQPDEGLPLASLLAYDRESEA